MSKNINNILKEAGVFLVPALLVLTALVMFPTTVADSSVVLLEEYDWLCTTNPMGHSNLYFPGYDDGWRDEQHKTIAYYYGWRQSDSTESGGSSLEAVIFYYYCRADYVFHSDDFSTDGYCDCVLEFKSYINHYSGEGLYSLHAGWSIDETTWHEVWSETPDNSYNYHVYMPLPSDAEDKPTVYIGFWVEGNPYWFNYWYIDDVSVTATVLLDADFYIDPETLRERNSRPDEMKCFIEPPITRNVADIDRGSIDLYVNGVMISYIPYGWGDTEDEKPEGPPIGNGFVELKFNFQRSEIEPYLVYGVNTITVKGEFLSDGTKFQGTDTITYNP